MEDLSAVVLNETHAYAFPWTPGVFADCLTAAYDCWIVHRSHRVLGHGILSVVAGEAHVLNVCIAREHQAQGLGRQLVEHLLHRARVRGADVVFLEVRASNRVAARLYESMGFNEVGVRRNYYPTQRGHEDARVLATQLL